MFAAPARDYGGLVGCFGTKAMIDSGGFDLAGECGMGEGEQRHAVWAARHGNAEAVVLADRTAKQTFKVGGEAG